MRQNRTSLIIKRTDWGLLINSAEAKVLQLRGRGGFLNWEKWFNFFAVSLSFANEERTSAGVGRDGITRREKRQWEADRGSHQIWIVGKDGWIKAREKYGGHEIFPDSQVHRAFTRLGGMPRIGKLLDGYQPSLEEFRSFRLYVSETFDFDGVTGNARFYTYN